MRETREKCFYSHCFKITREIELDLNIDSISKRERNEVNFQ